MIAPWTTERFAKKTAVVGDCVEWTGCIGSRGYGVIKINKRQVYAHRVSWELHCGRIPRGRGYHGTCVLHRCDNPRCVKPDHLFLGTMADNIADRDAKRRAPDFKGHRNGNASLTDDIVRGIRRALSAGEMGSVIADRLGVSRTCVSKIKLGLRWAHVT